MHIEIAIGWTDHPEPIRACPVDLTCVSTRKRGEPFYILTPAPRINARAHLVCCVRCGERVLAAQKKMALLEPAPRDALCAAARAASHEAMSSGPGQAIRAWLAVVEAA